jgi:endoglucanase
MIRGCVAIILFLSCLGPAQSAPLASVPPSRLAHLRHGINLSGWFAQIYDGGGYTKEHFQTSNTATDLALIKSMGFDHVRLSVNPEPLMEAMEQQDKGTEYLGYLDAAVKLSLDAGLSVELDIHPESEFKSHLGDDAFVQRFADFWRSLARHYSSWDSDRLLFEIIDEPEMRDPYRWAGIQTKVAAAIRQGASQHTIIATGASWNNEGDLLFIEPLRDPNVVYALHYYEPHIFTHQGATWGDYYWRWLSGLHYPSSPENATQVAKLIPEARDRLNVIRYGQEHWDAARTEALIGQAADWARERHVTLICNEFGAYRDGVEPQDRAAWIKDVRATLEHHGISWTMWDYSGNFGIVTKKDGKAVLDENIVKALGLR